MILDVLTVEHYDSYSNNLLQLLEGTFRSESSGREIDWRSKIIKFDDYAWPELKALLPNFDAVILSPGPGRPDRKEDFTFDAREVDIPILGVCLGHQGIGTAFGARIGHAPDIKHGQITAIEHDGEGLLRGIPQDFEGVRYNSLVLDPASLPEELVPTAWTWDDDGKGGKERVLMGLRHISKPIHGVQWHPESICSKFGRHVMENFTRIVEEYWGSRLEERVLQRARGSSSRAATTNFSNGMLPTPASSPPPEKRSPKKAYEVQRRKVALGGDIKPADVFDSLIRGSTKDGEIWLDSSKFHKERSRYSYLAAGVASITYSTLTKCVIISCEGEVTRTIQLESTFWDWLDGFQEQLQSLTRMAPVSSDERRARLQVGLLGYFGYEMKRESLPGYSAPDDLPSEVDRAPDVQILFARAVLCYDHEESHWEVSGLVRQTEDDPMAAMIGAQAGIAFSRLEFEAYLKYLDSAMRSHQIQCKTRPVDLPAFVSQTSNDSYSEKIRQVKAAIQEGESYEMTLTTKFKAQLQGRDPFAMYLALRTKNPAPYSAYMNFPTSDTTILSSSPEKFISIAGDGQVEMKPIKGTVAVHPDPEINRQRKEKLATDVKELAENLMIVDLIRNDLHRVSPAASIRVSKLLHVETYETVHQLVTTINSTIDPSTGSVKALQSVFPPGSMTGAPKLRSVQILDSLEDSQERGPYSGCLGYIGINGEVDMAVVIRTIVRRGKELELGAGGAITWLSDAEKEWEEVLVKANAVAKASGCVSNRRKTAGLCQDGHG